MNTNPLKEYRCYLSKKLLCKASWDWQIEIMNNDNRAINYVWPSRVNQDIGLKWQAFINLSVDLRCGECKRLLWRAIWTDLIVEIKCNHCHKLNTISIAELESQRMSTLSLRQREQVIKNKQRNMSKI